MEDVIRFKVSESDPDVYVCMSPFWMFFLLSVCVRLLDSLQTVDIIWCWSGGSAARKWAHIPCCKESTQNNKKMCVGLYYWFLKSFKKYSVHVASLSIFACMFLVCDTEHVNAKVLFVMVFEDFVW
jgi:hypothetical protein